MMLEATTSAEIKRESLERYKDRKVKMHTITTKRGLGRIARLRIKKNKV